MTFSRMEFEREVCDGPQFRVFATVLRKDSVKPLIRAVDLYYERSSRLGVFQHRSSGEPLF